MGHKCDGTQVPGQRRGRSLGPSPFRLTCSAVSQDILLGLETHHSSRGRHHMEHGGMEALLLGLQGGQHQL